MLNYFKNNQGMTLIEMLIVVFLFSILMVALGNTVASLYSAHSHIISQTYQVNNARQGVQTFVRDAREMTFSDNGVFPLARMEEHLIGFYSDIDTDDSVEYVEYELIAETTLVKRIHNAVGTPATYNKSVPDEVHILSIYVQNILQDKPTFTYYDMNGMVATPESLITDIRFVTIQIIVNIDPVRNPGEFMLRSSAALRNIIGNI